MKKTYLIPSTENIFIQTSFVCQTAVSSVRGPLDFGGTADPDDAL